MKKFVFTVIAAVILLGLFGNAIAADSGVESTRATVAPLWGCDSTGTDSLTTLFASNNNFAGNSFDVMAANQITIVGWDLNLDNSALSQYTIDIYWREGTADGFEQSASGWTQLGSEVVTAMGTDNKSHCNIGPFTIDAGDTVGFIITAQEAVSGTGGFNYTNGGPNSYGNPDIGITTLRGLADGFPPGSAFTYRAWNGCIHYVLGSPLQRNSWGAIKSIF